MCPAAPGEGGALSRCERTLGQVVGCLLSGCLDPEVAFFLDFVPFFYGSKAEKMAFGGSRWFVSLKAGGLLVSWPPVIVGCGEKPVACMHAGRRGLNAGSRNTTFGVVGLQEYHNSNICVFSAASKHMDIYIYICIYVCIHPSIQTIYI